ncbi:hypothetical protein BDW74DRAFT_168138 [Aspergillus multicolor]|uniref:ankyrin repeat domain-containing protein n=1 Tax=Aspergillus multicolor TaxID=41759 RepID=UPI003CCD6E56
MPKPILQKSKSEPIPVDADRIEPEPGDLEIEDAAAEAATPPIILVEPHDQPESESSATPNSSLAPRNSAVIRAEEDWTGVVEFLIQKGAEVGLRDKSGKTALHKAVVAGSADLVELLIQNGASVDDADDLGHSALHLCVVSESLEAMEVLLRYDADVNLRDGRGHTVLHLAAQYGWVDAVDPLLENGADTTITDEDGLTPMQVAKEEGADGVAELLRLRDGTSSKGSSKPPSVHYVRPADAHHNLWAGVQRDNGDGFILASYDNHDISFDAKMESIRPIFHEGKDMHEIQIKLNFMRPYSMDHRIRYARVDVNLGASGGDAPNIRAIMPQADRMEVSEQEITSGKTFTVGASGNGGPSNVNISMEGSKSKKSTFKGVRIIHGAIRDQMHACWRLYEEPGSRSGLPEIVRLLLLVHCEAEFNVRLDLSVKACHFLTFGIPRTLTAPKGLSYTVPKLNVITAYEHSSRLRQMLDVADRAATTIEETHRLEELFARAMRVHKKRHLIMNASRDDDHVTEWNAILDDARTSDFTTLRYKLLEMEEADRAKTYWPGHNAYQSDSGSPPPPARPRAARPRPSTAVYYDELPEAYMRRHRRAVTRDFGYYDDRNSLRGRDHVPATRNPLENFTAVGPGYHVSRLA